MELKVSLCCSQALAIGSCFEPDEFYPPKFQLDLF